VLELSRQASSEGGAPILKGTAGGNATAFHIRSCFLFSSIGVASVNRADTSRVTILELIKPDEGQGEKLFTHVKDFWGNTILKPGWCARLRARALSLASTIRINAVTFASVIGRKLGDQRTGDQLGALLAGAFSLTDSGEITAEAAKKWIDGKDWSAWTPEAPDMDENKAQ
jgi:putative DNA primase/helicase